MSDIPPISGRIDIDASEARREVNRFGESVQDVSRDIEGIGEASQTSSRLSIDNITDLRSAFELLGSGIERVLGFLNEIDQTIEQTAQRSSRLEQVAQALGVTQRQAQGLTFLGAAVGVDEGDIRGFFDPLQEFGAEIVRRPDDPALQERVTQLRQLGFDPAALAQGGIGAIEQGLRTLGGLNIEQRAVLPAFGVSIEDVQRLAPFAQRFSQGFDLEFFEGLGIPSPIGLDVAADAELQRLERESRTIAREQIRAGVRRPGELTSNIFRIPGVSELTGFAEQVFDATGIDDFARSSFGLLGGSATAAVRAVDAIVNLDIDGESVGRITEDRRTFGGDSTRELP